MSYTNTPPSNIYSITRDSAIEVTKARNRKVIFTEMAEKGQVTLMCALTPREPNNIKIHHPLYDETETYKVAYDNLRKTVADLRNELCLRCGNYKEAHKGACDNCRWKEV